MKKVCIVTARPIGDACIAWAENHTPPEFELVQQTDEADIIISVLYNKILSPQEIENKITIIKYTNLFENFINNPCGCMLFFNDKLIGTVP